MNKLNIPIIKTDCVSLKDFKPLIHMDCLLSASTFWLENVDFVDNSLNDFNGWPTILRRILKVKDVKTFLG